MYDPFFGVPSEQAEAQAEVLTEAFNVNLEELVTKDYLAALFAEQRAYMDTRFIEERAHNDKRFAEQDSQLRILFWMISFIILVSSVPIVERLLSL